MWEYLGSLPTGMSFTIILLGILAILVISLRGSAFFKWGKNVVGLGNSKDSQNIDKDENTEDLSTNEQHITHTNTGAYTLPVPPPTVFLRQSMRSCGDCILIIMGEREKYELKISNVHDRVLKNQMNFFEQNIIELQELIEKIFSDAMGSTKIQAMVGNTGRGTEIEYKFFSELLKDALMQVKNEIRRSYKENGYYEMNDTEFSYYLKDKSKQVLSTITKHIKNIYPNQGMTVPISDILLGLSLKYPEISETIRSCFEQSKEVTLEAKNQIETYKNEFSVWADRFVVTE